MFRSKYYKKTIETQRRLIKRRDDFIQAQSKENQRLRARIYDLEVEIEFLFNNLTPKKRELARPTKQTNSHE